jgi:hypothetical protein
MQLKKGIMCTGRVFYFADNEENYFTVMEKGTAK